VSRPSSPRRSQLSADAQQHAEYPRLACSSTRVLGRSGGPLRIVFLGPYDAVGGAVPRIVRDLSAGLAERGWVVSSRLWGARSSSEGRAHKVLSRAQDAIRIADEVISSGADIVVIHSGMDWKTVPRDILLCSRLRRHVSTIVLQPHGGHAEWVGDDRPTTFRMLARRLLKLVDGVFVLSWEEAVMYAKGEPTVAVQRIANPFVAADYEKVAAPESGRETNLLFVGRLVETKGILDAIEAVSLISCPVTLTIAGDGPLLPRARVLSQELGLGARVRFVGRLEGEALRDLYNTSDVLVLPTFWAEGFPTVLAEAMAAGLGIVTTPIRGAIDYLADGVNCLFVAPRRPGEIAAAVEQLHDERRLLQRMGESNRAVVQQFAPGTVVDEYEKALLCVHAASRSAVT
jgi:glycosyltransferase involved in cell wall biosynthesis